MNQFTLHAVGEIVLFKEFSAAHLSFEEGLEIKNCCAPIDGVNGRTRSAKGVDTHVWLCVGTVRVACALTLTWLEIWSTISSPFGSSDFGALRRYKSLMWLSHTARFAPSIAS